MHVESRMRSGYLSVICRVCRGQHRFLSGVRIAAWVLLCCLQVTCLLVSCSAGEVYHSSHAGLPMRHLE